jgi:hypothetical protein
VPLASVEGLAITLLFVVPGALGLGVRNYLWASKQRSSFDQVLLAMTYSAGALFLLELGTGIIGLATQSDWMPGSFLTNDLLAVDFVARFRNHPSSWYRFLGFATCATALPSALRWLRTRPVVLELKPVRHLSLFSDGFEALVEETRFEAADWDERWTFEAEVSPWLVVDLEDGQRYMGHVMWRSTAPDPLELILIDVKDVTDPDALAEIPGLLLVRGEDLTRVWVMRPDHV